MEWLRNIDIEEAETFLQVPEACKEGLFPYRVHPRVAELEREMEAWVAKRAGHIEDEVRKLNEARLGLLVARFWPHVQDPERAATLFKVIYLIFLVDDVVDETHKTNSEHVAQVMAHVVHAIFGGLDPGAGAGFMVVSAPKEQLVVDVVREIWGDIQRDQNTSSKQRARYGAALRDYILAQVPNTRLREQVEANMALRVEEYMPIRGLSSGQPLCATMSEYELGLELDDETVGDPLVKQLREVACDYCSIVNDILSFRKEFSIGDVLNLLTLLHIRNNIVEHDAGGAPVPFHVTVSQAWDMLHACERDCARLASLIMQSPHLGVKPGIESYVQALCGFTTALRVWTMGSDRYKQNAFPRPRAPATATT